MSYICFTFAQACVQCFMVSCPEDAPVISWLKKIALSFFVTKIHFFCPVNKEPGRICSFSLLVCEPYMTADWQGLERHQTVARCTCLTVVTHLYSAIPAMSFALSTPGAHATCTSCIQDPKIKAVIFVKCQMCWFVSIVDLSACFHNCNNWIN